MKIDQIKTKCSSWLNRFQLPGNRCFFVGYSSIWGFDSGFIYLWVWHSLIILITLYNVNPFFFQVTPFFFQLSVDRFQLLFSHHCFFCQIWAVWPTGASAAAGWCSYTLVSHRMDLLHLNILMLLLVSFHPEAASLKSTDWISTLLQPAAQNLGNHEFHIHVSLGGRCVFMFTHQRPSSQFKSLNQLSVDSASLACSTSLACSASSFSGSVLVIAAIARAQTVQMLEH